ncbi:hypothetical protein OG216_28895 [Streptomycetaceae bacterium NBC_01309]
MASAMRTVMAASIGAAVALGVAAPAATAAPKAPGPTRLEPALDAAVPAAVNPVSKVALNPLAGTGVDPLDNSVGTTVGDLPLSTAMLTGQVADGTNLQEIVRGITG